MSSALEIATNQHVMKILNKISNLIKQTSKFMPQFPLSHTWSLSPGLNMFVATCFNILQEHHKRIGNGMVIRIQGGTGWGLGPN